MSISLTWQITKQIWKNAPNTVAKIFWGNNHSLKKRSETRIMNGIDSSEIKSKFEPALEVSEEWDVLIHINQKGNCTFKVPGTDKSSCQNIDQTSITSTNKGSSAALCMSSNNNNEGGSGGTKNDSAGTNSNLEMNYPHRIIPPSSLFVGMDCEFVGVNNDQSALGRCSVVDYNGNVLCDIYAKPLERITTYRTKWSGITKGHMEKAIPQEFALAKIKKVLEGKIVVGHDLQNDFRVLGIHPVWANIRDTSHYPFYSEGDSISSKSTRPALKRLANDFLGIQIQRGCHCSVTDAQAAMSLYKLVRDKWESRLLQVPPVVKPGPSGSGASSGGKGPVQGSSSENTVPPTSGKQLSINQGLEHSLMREVQTNDSQTRKRRARKRSYYRRNNRGPVLENQRTASKDITTQVASNCATTENYDLETLKKKFKSSEMNNIGSFKLGQVDMSRDNKSQQSNYNSQPKNVNGKRNKMKSSQKTYEDLHAASSSGNVEHLFEDQFWPGVNNHNH